jgi:histone H3/H4
MKINDDMARRLMAAGEIFQRKLTRMAARLAQDDGRDEISQNDVDAAMVMLLTKEATDNWERP